MTHKILILGDFNPEFLTHHALNDSIRHSGKFTGSNLDCDWIGTDKFNLNLLASGDYSGLWIAPGSPYKNEENVFSAIEFARRNNIPALGNCGGFQYMILEFARNVCGISDADHKETNPYACNPVIAKLSCSLIQKEEQLLVIDNNSKLYEIIKQNSFRGRYFCSYGINDNYVQLLAESGCSMTAVSSDGNIRAFELKSHPFFLGTLFQPALNSSFDEPDPIITSFFRKCIEIKTPITNAAS